ncbi:hypothetical protein [Paracidovorax anthurii]|uniref:Uncharacterized protein n=1 Tax=Paracidovorax anthurii TaxID=78229 RepID=A0A328YYY5_9BURK|nr:hypothetical protein [Paracidovorax anthurii]RAR77432.1 hypothetical protein AX018_103745 [Paracidovorax anthurii]
MTHPPAAALHGPAPADPLSAFAEALAALRDTRITPHAFSEQARAQAARLPALPPRYAQVLSDLLDRLESSALFSEESCSFSQRGLIEGLETWAARAREQLARPPGS